jgi:hypothetical protein
MSTKHKLTNPTESDTSTESGNNQSKVKGLDLSATQIVGGALAAMTAAALGSQLSVAGTIVGAAFASIIAAVAGSLYTASLRRTSNKVKTVFWTGQPNEVEEPTVMEILEDREGHVAGQRSHLVAPESIDSSPGRKLNWKRVLVAAMAAFGIAAASLTAFELATGNALSGGEGTTIQQVRKSNVSTESDSKNKKESPSEEPTKEPTTAASEAAPTDEPSYAPRSEPTDATTVPTPDAQATTTEPETIPSSNNSAR